MKLNSYCVGRVGAMFAVRPTIFTNQPFSIEWDLISVEWNLREREEQLKIDSNRHDFHSIIVLIRGGRRCGEESLNN